MKKILSILLALLLLTTAVPLFSSASTKVIVDVVGIALPIPGQKPDFTAEFPDYQNNVKISKVNWTEYDEGWEWQREMASNDTFKADYWYVVTVYLEAVGSGNDFASDAYGYIDGKKANNYAPTNNNTKFTMYTSYQALASNAENVIDAVSLNVVMPTAGKTPTFAKIETPEYKSSTYGTGIISNIKNGVVWKNEKTNANLSISNAFKADCTYSFCCYLDAKDGYVFNTETTKVYINGQKADCAAVVNKGNNRTNVLAVSMSGIVPKDGKEEIKLIDLSVTAPHDSEKPNYTKIDTTGYFSDNGMHGTSTKIYKNGIAWYKSSTSYISPGTTETFKGGTDYTVKIALTPKDGYKFDQNVTAKINGKTASITSFDDGSIEVSLTLTAASKEHVHTEGSAWQYDNDNHWKICSDTNCGTIIGEKQAHADSDKNGKCDVCDYKFPEETKAPEIVTTVPSNVTEPSEITTNATATDAPDENTENVTNSDVSVETITAPTENTDEPESAVSSTEETNSDNGEKQSNSPVIWIVIGAIAIIALITAVVIILMKKKK